MDADNSDGETRLTLQLNHDGLPSGHFCPTLGKERAVEVRWEANRGKGSHGLLYYGSEMTTVRNLKDFK